MLQHVKTSLTMLQASSSAKCEAVSECGPSVCETLLAGMCHRGAPAYMHARELPTKLLFGIWSGQQRRYWQETLLKKWRQQQTGPPNHEAAR